MKDIINKAFLAGLGAISLTREKLESFIEELVKQGEISRGDKPGIISNLYKEMEKRRDDLKAFIRKEVKKILKGLDIPTREEVDALKEEMERMRGGKSRKKTSP